MYARIDTSLHILHALLLTDGLERHYMDVLMCWNDSTTLCHGRYCMYTYDMTPVSCEAEVYAPFTPATMARHKNTGTNGFH
jgi:hypothetical protein